MAFMIRRIVLNDYTIIYAAENIRNKQLVLRHFAITVLRDSHFTPILLAREYARMFGS